MNIGHIAGAKRAHLQNTHELSATYSPGSNNRGMKKCDFFRCSEHHHIILD